MVQVVEDIFGLCINPMTKVPEIIRRFTLTNNNHMSVQVITLGAIITSVKVPDAYQRLEDVCLGFDDVTGYLANRGAYFGATLGRVANRVKDGLFRLQDEKVVLTKNFQNKYHLHGGFIGFDSVIWTVHSLLPDGVTLQHISKHGHEGYPGDLTTKIQYTLDEDDRFIMRVFAETTQLTTVNITNHAYFNLAGHGTGKKTLCEHYITLDSANIVDTDIDQIPTGDLLDVQDTVFDLRMPVLIGDRLRQFEGRNIDGYDNCFCVNSNAQPHQTQFIAKVLHPDTGRTLEISTNQPGVQFYTANNLPEEDSNDEMVIGKGCAHYMKHGSFCLETEKYPDAMNNLNFPNIFLSPGEKYFHEVVYKFGIEQRWKCCVDEETAK